MAKRKKLVLFDGHALLHRGFHAIPYLSAKDGTPTNGVFGFTTILFKAIADLKPDYVVVGWDMPGPTFRHKIYDDYKGTRAEIDESLVKQIPVTKELVQTFNIPLIEKPGYEADDVIGALAKRYNGTHDVIIVTGDMDELQLVDSHTQVYTMRRGFTDTVLYDEAAVVEKYGVTPTEFITYKALKGDTSDNIPGVVGIGDKTATELVSEYKTLDAMYANLDKIRPALRAKLEKDKENAYLSLELSAIKTDIDIPFDLRDAEVDGYDRKKVFDLFQRLGFRSLLNKLPGSGLNTNNVQSELFTDEGMQKNEPSIGREHLKKAKYICVDNQQALDDLIAVLSKQECFAFDTETDSVDVVTANLVGMSFSCKAGEAYYLPVGHVAGEQLDKQAVLEALKPLLGDKKIGKIGHNIKFDYQIMAQHGVELAGISFDTMVANYLINPLLRAQTLSELAFAELGIEMVEITELIGPKGKTQKTFAEADIKEAVVYAAEDADITWRLYEVLAPRLKKLGRVDEVAQQMEWPLIPVLGDIELQGVELDTSYLAKFAKKIDTDIVKCQEQIWKLAGGHFNISSTQQLKEVLFDKLKIQSDNLKKIKSGVSTAASELEKLRGSHKIIDLIFEYRELTKLKSTYVDALPLLVSKRDGRVHTSYNQTIAQTGRLSSNNPNLQNIPVRTALGKLVRNAFVAAKGKVFVSADYSQIELRLAAELAHDKEMIRAFEDGADIHRLTAAQLYEVKPEDVTTEQRYAAKTINFGILYGMNPHGLSVATGMDNHQAREFIDRYFSIRRGVADYIESVKHFARKEGYTESLFGRRRPCPDVVSNNFIVRSAAERAAVNMPLQATAADMMKLAMIKVAKRLPEGAHIILQIHDELIVECDASQADAVSKILRDNMINVHKFSVPIDVGIKTGKNWGELE